MRELVFLKLGGSLITDKNRRYAPRLDKLSALAHEIRSSLASLPDVHLLLGHGSGSFGHFAVQEHLASKTFRASAEGTPEGNKDYWRGFSEVWYRASELNRHVMMALHESGLSAIALAPSATVRAADGEIVEWDLTALDSALQSALIPVIFGDIVFDATRGGTVLSTEKLMMHLAHRLRPDRILLAGLEEGVWADFPKRQTVIGKITPQTYASVSSKIGASEATDVTGGMRAKVEEMLALVQEIPGLSGQIFSGERPGNLQAALRREPIGTVIAHD